MTPKATEMLGAREVRLSEQWRVHTNAQRTAILNGWGHIVATVSSPEEAMRIMQCVSAHDGLVAELQRCANYLQAAGTDPGLSDDTSRCLLLERAAGARAALAKATGSAT